MVSLGSITTPPCKTNARHGSKRLGSVGVYLHQQIGICIDYVLEETCVVQSQALAVPIGFLQHFVQHLYIIQDGLLDCAGFCQFEDVGIIV